MHPIAEPCQVDHTESPSTQLLDNFEALIASFWTVTFGSKQLTFEFGIRT